MIQAPVTRQEAHEVPIGQIESELARLWRESDAATLAAGGQILARNSVMTLVVFARGQEQARYVARAIEGLTGQHPSRAIILALQPDATGASISASVSIHSHSPQNNGVGQVRAEQIMLTVNGDATQHLPGVVLPLLLTELPAFVWWTGALPSGELVQSLNDACDRAIIDSADFAAPERDLVRMADMLQSQMHPINRTAFSDFNWTRIKPWRELTAQFFDNPRYRPYLDGVERVEIEFAVDAQSTPNPIQAYLFAGWLASRLKWQTLTGVHSAGGAARLGLRTHAGAPIAVEIAPRNNIPTRDWWSTSSAEWPVELGDGLSTEGEDEEKIQTNRHSGHVSGALSVSTGGIMRINIQTRLNGQSVSFTILREDDMKNAMTVVVGDGDTAQQRRTPLDSYGETALLHQQLGIFERNHIYEEAILATRSMVTSDGNRSGSRNR